MCETEFSVVRFSGDEGMKPLSADDIACHRLGSVTAGYQYQSD